MTRQRAKLWLVVASLFALLNLGAAGVAAVAGEALHTVAHIALSLLGAYFVWRLAPRARRQEMLAEQEAEPRLERLQQALDAIGLEVERIGEAQRFTAKIVAERAHAASPKPPREAGT
jgi:ABC-type nickel/cobalt efflux system permease component RcnA